jgi:hypothetical protein
MVLIMDKCEIEVVEQARKELIKYWNHYNIDFYLYEGTLKDITPEQLLMHASGVRLKLENYRKRRAGNE